MIAIVVAVDKKNGIGLKGMTPWKLSEDLKNFKKLTTGGVVIMGRKTYESIGRALPNRRNIIISKTLKEVEGAEVFSSVDEALSTCGIYENVFIIGGGEIYKETIEQADVLYVTHIEKEFEADTFFPEINLGIWKLAESNRIEHGEVFEHPFSFCRYTRIG